MQISQTNLVVRTASTAGNSPFNVMLSSAFAAFLALVAFHMSMIATSVPLSETETEAVERAISLLDERGFKTEAFMLRHTTTFRGTDNWLNLLTEKENAFAATNFPFQLVTLYSDFFTRTTDDTERAMVLLHEAQHLMSKDEPGAFGYVWRHRDQLGWTQRSHGTSGAFVTIEQQTRELVPELFQCPSNLWSDCTAGLRAGK